MDDNNVTEFSCAQTTFASLPSYNIVFHNEHGEIGRIDFNGDKMVFTGEAEESAKVFFDYLANLFADRFKVKP